MFHDENRLRHDELANLLDKYKRTAGLTNPFNLILNSFSEVFPNTSFDILSKDSSEASEGTNPNKKNYIQITESIDNESLDHPLENTAFGYFETIGIFTAVVTGNRNVIFLEEPALHLHLTKIKYFGRTLIGMS